MKYIERIKKILVLIICFAMLAGGVLLPVEAKADMHTWDVKIYPHTDGKIYYMYSGYAGPGTILNYGDTIELPANNWIFVKTSLSLGFWENDAENYRTDEYYDISSNSYYNIYRCGISVTVTEYTAGKYRIDFHPIVTESDETNVSAKVEKPVQKAVPSTPHVHSWSYGTIVEPTEDSDGLEGETCSCGAQRNTSVIPAIGVVIQNRYQQIEQAHPGKDTILEMKNNCNFSQAFMKKLAAKNDCSFIIRFTYEHKNYEVYIPAGTVFDTSLEWYGPKKIMEMFEWKLLN